TDKVHEKLKGLDAHLVTSGISQIHLPSINLELPFKQYIMLLQASSVVVLMSQIQEGWNRVAHEAILCRTPVIGSGSGGMKELLTKSGQHICEDWSQLGKMVLSVLQNPPESEAGYEYAKQFSVNQYKRSWIKLIHARYSLNAGETGK
ncbi:glycosyltransferase, partial [Sulfuricurvum sp.]|uniref:glycosyltransferase n=1 Tax=Sulfuricurvum sp. TaxID=2025608 RepID=UPI00261D14FB